MSQCADAVPALDVVKIFFDTFWIVRDGTTLNTVQTRRQLEGFLMPSVLTLGKVQQVFATRAICARITHGEGGEKVRSGEWM